MRHALAALAVVAPLLLAGCGDDGNDATARDPGSSPNPPAADAMPTEVPAAAGPVHTRTTATVMDTGRPELCLGAVAESYPPQCGGPPIEGWDWADAQGMFDRQGDTRWGEFKVYGRWDGETFTVTGLVAAALYDPEAPSPTPTPRPAVDLSERELQAIAEEVGGNLPGAKGAYALDGHVLVDVVYDDGSLQAWCDEEYGDGVVLVTSALVDAS